MSDFLVPSHEAETPPASAEPKPAEPVLSRRRRVQRRTLRDGLRFHLLLNLTLAIAATWVLKLDGPYYADGIAAGIFVVGFLIAIWSFRTMRRSQALLQESRPDQPAVSTAPVFIALAVFFIAAAAAVIWFTYIAPPEPVYSDETVAMLGGPPSALRRQLT